MSQSRRGLLGSIVVAGTSALVYIAPEGSDRTYVPGFSTEDLDVSTLEPQDIEWESVTLVGSLDYLGEPDSADVFFELWDAETEDIVTTARETLTEEREFFRAVNGQHGLEPETTYQVVALAEAGDVSVEGSTVEFTTEAVPNIEVVTTDTVDEIDTDQARLNGEVTDLTNTEEADAYFEYRPATAETRTDSEKQVVMEPQAYDQLLTGLEPGTEYEGRARAVGRDRDVEDVGEFVTWTTESAIPDNETFEHNDLTGTHGGDTGAFDIQTSTVDEGSYALYGSNGGNRGIIVRDTDQEMWGRGYRINYRLYLPNDINGNGGIAFGAQSVAGAGSFSGYTIYIDGNDSTIHAIDRLDDGSSTRLDSTSPTLTQGAWVDASVEYRTDDTIQSTVDGDSLTVTDATYNEGYLGVLCFRDVYIDNIQFEEL